MSQRSWAAPAKRETHGSRTSLGVPYHLKPRCKLDVFLARARPAPSPEPQSSPPISRVSSVTTLPDVDVGSQVDGEFPAGTWGDLAPGSPINGDPNLSPVVMLIYDVGTMGPIKPQKWMFWLLGNKLAEQGYGEPQSCSCS